MTKKSDHFSGIPATSTDAVTGSSAAASIGLASGSKTPSNSVLDGFSATASGYIAAAQSSATVRAYASDIRHFQANGGTVPASPPQIVEYLAQFAGKLSTATLERRLTAIHKAHQEISAISPVLDAAVKRTMQGIRRTFGTRQRQVAPMVRDVLLETLVLIDQQQPLKAARDRALLLLGFAGAFRRSELVAVRTDHLAYLDHGIEVFLPHSKTDQEGQGRTVFIPNANGSRCPVRELAQWLEVSGIKEGFVFRAVDRHGRVARHGLSAQSVALVVKASVGKAGGDSAAVSGHSLRAGYCTTAAMTGLAAWQIREVTGHRSDVTVARYIRPVARRSVKTLL